MSGTTVTSTDNPWLSTDVGKKLQGTTGGVTAYGTVGTQSAQVTITGFTSSSSITVSTTPSNGGTGNCVWYTQQEQASMLAAYTAADCGASKCSEPSAGGTAVLKRPGRVFIPKGGYVVCGPIYNDVNHVGTNIEGVSLIGDGPGVDIYVAPCFVPNPNATMGALIASYLTQRAEFSGFTINGMGFLINNFQAGQSLFGTQSSGKLWIHDIGIYNLGLAFTNDQVFGMSQTGAMNRIENLEVQNGANGDQGVGCYFNNAGVDIISSFCSNHFVNWLIQNSGQRTVFGPHFVMHGVQGDECTNNNVACLQAQNSTINCIGCELLNPANSTPSVSLDTTSTMYFVDSFLTPYDSDGGNANAIVLAGNAQVFATGSTFVGSAASAAVAGPSTSRFFDLGGNLFFNQVAGVQTQCTAANIFTCGFSGGITPIFPLAPGATTQLGARQIVAAGTGTGSPTFAVTGFGTGPTVAVQTGSTDAAGAALITAGTTPAATGTFTVTFSTVSGAYGTNPPVCTFTLVNGTGSWNALAQEPIIQTPTTTSVIANWSNNAVALTAASTYGFNWSCYGK
jgi:hypothetical protein